MDDRVAKCMFFLIERHTFQFCGELHSSIDTGIYKTSLSLEQLSRDARKPVFGVSDQVRHKPACTSSEKS